MLRWLGQSERLYVLVNAMNPPPDPHRDYDAQRNDPSPDEIDQRAAEIRKRWSNYVLHKRAGVRVRPLEVVRIDERDLS